MKNHHTEGARTDARAQLDLARIPLGADFHELSSAQVDELLKLADAARYQRPKGANGSRARYYHDRLQRRARAD